jgi:hypothetical protein
MYSYLKWIVYDKLLKPRQSFRITLYKVKVKTEGLRVKEEEEKEE